MVPSLSPLPPLFPRASYNGTIGMTHDAMKNVGVQRSGDCVMVCPVLDVAFDKVVLVVRQRHGLRCCQLDEGDRLQPAEMCLFWAAATSSWGSSAANCPVLGEFYAGHVSSRVTPHPPSPLPALCGGVTYGTPVHLLYGVMAEASDLFLMVARREVPPFISWTVRWRLGSRPCPS